MLSIALLSCFAATSAKLVDFKTARNSGTAAFEINSEGNYLIT